MVYLVLSLSQPSFQFIAYHYAYSYLSIPYKNTLERKIINTPLKSKSFVPCIKKVRRRDEIMRDLTDSLTCISTFFSYLPKISGIILQCYHFYFGTQLFFVCLFVLSFFFFKMALNFNHHCQAFCLLLAFRAA